MTEEKEIQISEDDIKQELLSLSGGEDQAPALEVVEEVLPSELEDTQALSILESLLFATNHPLSVSTLRGVFHGTNVNSDRIHELIEKLTTSYAGGERGITLEEVAGGFQIRTKSENVGWLRRLVKGRPFRLSGPAMEVLSIVAYKQPITKAEIDQIRGVESGHLLRALIEKHICRMEGKSELPGKPMTYGTTKVFLELFGLRNLRELPSLNEIDELIPEGIGELKDVEGDTLGSLSDREALPMGKSYSDSENELLQITEDLAQISTSSEFFEEEKKRQREKRDNDRAQDIRERMVIGEMVSDEDQKWLSRFEAKINKLIEPEPEPKPELVINLDEQKVEEVLELSEKLEDTSVQNLAEAARKALFDIEEPAEESDSENENTP